MAGWTLVEVGAGATTGTLVGVTVGLGAGTTGVTAAVPVAGFVFFELVAIPIGTGFVIKISPPANTPAATDGEADVVDVGATGVELTPVAHGWPNGWMPEIFVLPETK